MASLLRLPEAPCEVLVHGQGIPQVGLENRETVGNRGSRGQALDLAQTKVPALPPDMTFEPSGAGKDGTMMCEPGALGECLTISEPRFSAPEKWQ